MVVLGAAIAGVLGLAPTAQASTSCTSPNADDKVCLFQNAPATDGGVVRIDFLSRPSWVPLQYDNSSHYLYAGDGVLTNVSAAINWDLNSRVAFYYNSNYYGPCFTVAAGGQIGSFARIALSNGRSANDNMNSHHFNRTCGTVYNFGY
jgi:hypothetical protein